MDIFNTKPLSGQPPLPTRELWRALLEIHNHYLIDKVAWYRARTRWQHSAAPSPGSPLALGLLARHRRRRGVDGQGARASGLTARHGEQVTALHAPFRSPRERSEPFAHRRRSRRATNLESKQQPMAKTKRRTTPKPSAMLGAGQLVSAVWKTADQRGGRSCRFNVYRMDPHNGSVSQLLRPNDVHDLVKLCHVLAATLADDGCIPAEQRRALADLAERLSHITHTRS